ncbi:CCR4-NOT transcription complex subunit 4-like isoform X2 [Uloborus diversus]|uniref:CCR4-NOT transcription complex subunit 4-like isoform X2 n=1 Tax=Uloborus diversus TaxID=327109 RepID=UPI00240A0F61|nr:CCR4-NOT transcription complex subunit 4-like isoform X2 [Uloborus diversus]
MCKFVRKAGKRGSFNHRKVPEKFIHAMRVKNSKNSSGSQKKSAFTEHASECPLCLDALELDDANFFPCPCGYQICRFCWHRIRTNENGLCPQCRKLYSEDPANFKPLTPEELQKLKTQKKAKESQKKQKILESRKQLANVRILQKNLVFVVGLPQGLDSDVERKQKIFQPFEGVGPILKSSLNDKTSYAGAQGPSACAYIVYQKSEDAVKAIKQYSNFKIEGRTLKVSLGTTKYCCNFLKNMPCHNKECMYLHELANDDACFTKEEIHAGKHLEYEAKLMEKILPSSSNSKSNSTRQESKKPENQDIGSSCSSLETSDGSESNDCRLSPSISPKATEKTSSKPSTPKLEENSSPGAISFLSCSSQGSSPEDSKFNESNEEVFCTNPLISRTVVFPGQPSSPVHSKNFSNGPVSPTPTNSTLHFSPQAVSPFSIPPQKPIPWQSPVSSSRPIMRGARSRGLPELHALSSNEVAQKIALDPTANDESPLSDELGFDPCEVALSGLRDLVKKKVHVSEQERLTRLLLKSILPPSGDVHLRQRNGLHQESRKKEQLSNFIPLMNGLSPVYSNPKPPVCDMNNHTFPTSMPPTFQNQLAGAFSVPRLPIRNNTFLPPVQWQQQPTPLPTQPRPEYISPQSSNFSQPGFMPFEQRNSALSPAELQTRMRMQRMQDLFRSSPHQVPSKPNFSLF